MKSNTPRIAALCLAVAAPLVSPLVAQHCVAIKPSVRPFTDHPYQACYDSLYSSYQSSTGFIEWSLQEMKRVGIEKARIEIPWLLMEPAQDGVYDWARTDLIMALCERYQIEVLATFISCSLTAGSGLTPTMHPACAPGLLQFIQDFLDRYPGQVDYVEIGNEPNQIYFVENFGWGRPSDKYFRDVLVPTAVALKGRYPGLKILNAGEFRQLPSLLFANLQIPALGRRETPLDWIDVFSVHYVNTITELQAMRSQLDSAGYPNVEIWLTECDHYDNWGGQPWGFRDLVQQAHPQLVTQFFEYMDIDGRLMKMDPATGQRYSRYDDGGILAFQFDRNNQNYRDFTAATGGPFSIDAFSPRVGVAFSRLAVRSASPGAAWSESLLMSNLGRDAHEVDLLYSGTRAPGRLSLPAGYGRAQLNLQGTMPSARTERIEVLARSRTDGAHADLNRILLRAPRGSNLSLSALHDPRHAALFDGNSSTAYLAAGTPEDVVVEWGSRVRIEEMEIRTAAGDLVDIASSFIDLEHWDGQGWTRFGESWAREGRDASGPHEFRVVEDGMSIPELPLTTRKLRLRIWHRARIAGIEFYGDPAPPNAAPVCRLRYVPVSGPGAPLSWRLEGEIYEAEDLLGEVAALVLEVNGANDVLLPLIQIENLFGPIPWFDQTLVMPHTYRFAIHGSVGLPPGRYSFVLRAYDRAGRQDFDLVTVHQQ